MTKPDVNLTGSDQEPDLQTRRRILEQRINEFKAKGFDSAMRVEVMRVQHVRSKEDTDKLKQAIADELESSRNAYAGAKRLQGLLDQLPTVDDRLQLMDDSIP